MGRLSGFKYRDVVQKLRTFGYIFDRQGPGSHEVWRHVKSGRKVTLPQAT
jgi:predicted RNA binding protein YcfA (HicA-like mRNA interferase family)